MYLGAKATTKMDLASKFKLLVLSRHHNSGRMSPEETTETHGQGGSLLTVTSFMAQCAGLSWVQKMSVANRHATYL
jgi:hypothetical protein